MLIYVVPRNNLFGAPPPSLYAFLTTNCKMFTDHYRCTEILLHQVPHNFKSLWFVVRSCTSVAVLSWSLEYYCKLVLIHHLQEQEVKYLIDVIEKFYIGSLTVPSLLECSMRKETMLSPK